MDYQPKTQPCPWCGGLGTALPCGDIAQHWQIVCTHGSGVYGSGCGAQGPQRLTPQKAADAWNFVMRRADNVLAPQDDASIIEAIAEALDEAGVTPEELAEAEDET